MREPQQVNIQREQVTVDAIEQRYYLVSTHEKTAALARLFEVEEITSALIFVRTRAETTTLAAELSARGFPAEALSGDLIQEARERTLNRFRQGQVQVLVATDVAARGLDIDNISHVFNFQLPDDPEIYVHRIGRTGRAGKTGIAITFVSASERRRLGRVEAFTRKKILVATLPTEEDIRVKREASLTGKLLIWLKRGRFTRERELVEQMTAEGYDPLDIAAAALKVARGEEKQRPIHAVTVMTESVPHSEKRGFERKSYQDRSGDNSHESGMVRLKDENGQAARIEPERDRGFDRLACGDPRPCYRQDQHPGQPLICGYPRRYGSASTGQDAGCPHPPVADGAAGGVNRC